jgi:hypothetical protein
MAIIVVIVIIIAVAAFAAMAARRRRLKQRFGPEYDRMVASHQSQRKAEAELASRERRVRSLDIHPLTAAGRAEYLAQWASIQEQFVDHPSSAMSRAQQLVTAVLHDRGYPTDGYEQILADLSVEHARNLEHYRAALAISEEASGGSASTEDMRQAMIHYRAMFGDLLRGPASAAQDDAVQDPAAASANGTAAPADAASAAAPDDGAAVRRAPAEPAAESDPAVTGGRARDYRP